MSASRDLFTIVLVHAWTKERQVVPVETVTNTYVSIRWGQSGTYDLNLLKNVLTARSQKAQRKGKALWNAEDIHSVRKLAKAHMDGVDKKVETRIAMQRHVASMPGVASPEHIGSILKRNAFAAFVQPLEHAANEVLNVDVRCLEIQRKGQGGHVTCCNCPKPPSLLTRDSNPRIGSHTCDGTPAADADCKACAEEDEL